MTTWWATLTVYPVFAVGICHPTGSTQHPHPL